MGPGSQIRILGGLLGKYRGYEESNRFYCDLRLSQANIHFQLV